MRLAFLNNDSTFGKICTFIGTVILVNLMFVLTLLPMITADAGFCAMYYSILKIVRYILPLSAFIWCVCGFAMIAFVNSMFLMRLFSKYLDPLDEEEERNNERKILEDMRKLEG